MKFNLPNFLFINFFTNIFAFDLPLNLRLKKYNNISDCSNDLYNSKFDILTYINCDCSDYDSENCIKQVNFTDSFKNIVSCEIQNTNTSFDTCLKCDNTYIKISYKIYYIFYIYM